jgi:hypothetical protein
MAIRNEILNGALLQTHKSCGLKLVQVKDTILCLQTRHNHPVAYFAIDTPISDIRSAANNWMMETDLISYVGIK